jgi:hypothetical protein
VIEVAHKAKNINLDPNSSKYTSYRNEILTCEKNILQTIAFDLTMEHPYKFLLDYIKLVCGNTADADVTMKSLAQTAWNFVNDSLKTLVCLEYAPQIIAVASIHMAASFHKIDMPEMEGKPWFLSFGADEKSINEIREKLMALYQTPSTPEPVNRQMGGNMDMNAYKQWRGGQSPHTPQSPRTPTHSTPTNTEATMQLPYMSEPKETYPPHGNENVHPPLPKPPSEPPKPQHPPSQPGRQPPPPHQPDRPPQPEIGTLIRNIESPSRRDSHSPYRRSSRDNSPRRHNEKSRATDEVDMRRKLSNSKDERERENRRNEERSKSHEGSHEKSRERSDKEKK